MCGMGDGLTLMNISDNDFAIFGLEAQFALDAAALDRQWRTLQRRAHPDQFVTADAAQQRAALQRSARINEAYQRLKNPITRGAYLCELRGVPLQLESNTAMPADFLQQQMAWHEALDEAQEPPQIEALLNQVHTQKGQLLAQCAQALDQAGDVQHAATLVRRLIFLDKFESQLQARL